MFRNINTEKCLPQWKTRESLRDTKICKWETKSGKFLYIYSYAYDVKEEVYKLIKEHELIYIYITQPKSNVKIHVRKYIAINRWIQWSQLNDRHSSVRVIQNVDRLNTQFIQPFLAIYFLYNYHLIGYWSIFKKIFQDVPIQYPRRSLRA